MIACIHTAVLGPYLVGKFGTKDRRGGEGGTAIFSELKIADFPKLCGASLRHIYHSLTPSACHIVAYQAITGSAFNMHFR